MTLVEKHTNSCLPLHSEIGGNAAAEVDYPAQHAVIYHNSGLTGLWHQKQKSNGHNDSIQFFIFRIWKAFQGAMKNTKWRQITAHDEFDAKQGWKHNMPATYKSWRNVPFIRLLYVIAATQLCSDIFEFCAP